MAQEMRCGLSDHVLHRISVHWPIVADEGVRRL